MRLITAYSTGRPFVTSGAFVYAFLTMAAAVTFSDNEQAMVLAGMCLLIDAISQWVMHWTERPRS